MKPTHRAQRVLLSLFLSGGFALTPALGQINFNITLAPPPLLAETVPALTQDAIWVPGYWAWHDNRYIWIRGRSIAQRAGYSWLPDRWEQRDKAYFRAPGSWDRVQAHAVTPYMVVPKNHKLKKSKKHKNGKGNGKGNRE
jgi:hypothetical protein